jgi:hypothetical protein
MWISSNFATFLDFFNGNPHPLSLRAVFPTPKAFQGYFTSHLEIGFQPAVEEIPLHSQNEPVFKRGLL